MLEDNNKLTFPQQIASSLEKMIQDGVYKVGEKLPTEQKLAEKYGVSRGTVREALKTLTSVGILESRQGSGTFIKAKERLQIEVYRALENSSEKSVREIRTMLERQVAFLASHNRRNDDLKNMKMKLQERCNSKSRAKDRLFHESVAEATHNDFLISLYRYTQEYFTSRHENKGSPSIEDEEMTRLHEELYSAIEHHDEKLAIKAITDIIEA